MIRFAWMQTRATTSIAAVVLAALAVVAVVTGTHDAHVYSDLVLPCSKHADCGEAVNKFLSQNTFLQRALDLLMRLAPALVGLFWGAPLLAREFETGTFRLAWTQSVSRRRWLVTRFVVGALASVVISGLLTLLVVWWSRDFDKFGTNQYAVFDRRGVAPIAYSLFAFAAGVLAGTVIRRTVPAMAAMLGVFVFVRIAVSVWVRPHLLTPLHQTFSLLQGKQEFGFLLTPDGAADLVVRGPNIDNGWALSSRLVDPSGNAVTAAERIGFVQQHCPALVHAASSGPPDVGTVNACRQQAAETFRLAVVYHPASQYWPLQWLEVAVFLGLAGLAAAGCYWWITRRAV